MGKEEPYVDPEKTGGDALHNVSWVLSVPSPKTIFLALLCIVGCLTLASLVGQVSKYVLGHDVLLGFVNLFNLNNEMNVPAWYSSSTLLLYSILLGLIANHKMREGDGYFRHWVGLALIFVFLSLDEAISIHERLIAPMHLLLGGASGFFYFPWVIPYMIVVALFLLVYWKFIIDLTPTIRKLFFMAGAIYVGGALGMEMIDGFYFDVYGRDLTYELLVTIEEVGEMLGIVIFIYALCYYLSVYPEPNQSMLKE
jgi:hypothetical protein